MVLLPGLRCARLCQALLILVALFAGQRHVALGEEAAAGAAQDAIDFSKDAGAGASAASDEPPGACIDPTPLVEELEQDKAKIQSEFDTCEDKRTGLEHLLQGLEATVERQSKILDAAGGAKGIEKLREAAANARDVTAAAEEAAGLAEAARAEAESAREEARAAKEAAKGASAAAAAAKERAGRLASEKDSLQSKLDAAEMELKTLRSSLTRAEASESRTREKQKRTEYELELAKKPRVVSMSAIYEDLKQLANDLVTQSKNARDDIVAKALEKCEQVREVVQPHLETAVEASKPAAKLARQVIKTVMDKTEPQRAKAAKVFGVYRGKFDEAVGAPATEKWLSARAKVSKLFEQANSKYEELGEALFSKLMDAGMSRNEAQKTCKYLNIGVMSIVYGVLCYYLLRSFVTRIAWPLLRTVLRLALWLLKLPLRILFLPVRLVLWLLTKCFSMIFGGGGGSGGAVGGGGKGKSKVSHKKKRN